MLNPITQNAPIKDITTAYDSAVVISKYIEISKVISVANRAGIVYTAINTTHDSNA